MSSKYDYYINQLSPTTRQDDLLIFDTTPKILEISNYKSLIALPQPPINDMIEQNQCIDTTIHRARPTIDYIVDDSSVNIDDSLTSDTDDIYVNVFSTMSDEYIDDQMIEDLTSVLNNVVNSKILFTYINNDDLSLALTALNYQLVQDLRNICIKLCIDPKSVRDGKIRFKLRIQLINDIIEKILSQNDVSNKQQKHMTRILKNVVASKISYTDINNDDLDVAMAGIRFQLVQDLRNICIKLRIDTKSIRNGKMRFKLRIQLIYDIVNKLTSQYDIRRIATKFGIDIYSYRNGKNRIKLKPTLLANIIDTYMVF